MSLYDILGVNKTQSCTDIKKAYHKLAFTHHPDKGGDPEKFKEILRASEILTNDTKRRAYDEFGIIEGENPPGFPTQGFSQGFSQGFQFPFEININDLFGGMFHGQKGPQVGPQVGQRKVRKPAPTIQNINITLEQFYLGHNFDININRQHFCTNCERGAKSKEICKMCNGRAIISKIVQLGPMSMHTTGPCLDCQGIGEKILEKCDKCSGTGFLQEKRALSVTIVPGTRPQETYTFFEVCSDHPNFERPGDAHIIVGEDTNDPAFKSFKRSGDKLQNLEMIVSISLSESLIGCVVKIDGHPGYDEGLFIQIPSGSFHTDKYCLSGFGMPIIGNIGKYGDLFIIINVNITPMERNIFSTKGSELLAPLFEDKIRKCSSESIQNMYLV